MTLTLKGIKKLRDESDCPLTKDVCDYITNQWGDYDNKVHIFTDVLHHGCQSGVVSGLIYYSDTLAYYEKYKKDINQILSEMMTETNLHNPTELFGDNWDNDDPLALDTHNQNLLAWFGFEETLRRIGDNFEVVQAYI